jgi:hypothetical protein
MMNQFCIAAIAACLLAASAVAQPAAQAPQTGAAASAEATSHTLNVGATLQAELTKAIDTKKAKPGDEVSARLAQDLKTGDGQIVMRKGSKVVGHITEATPKTKENAESRLGLVFEKAVGKDGQELLFSGVIQAIAPPPQVSTPMGSDDRSGSGMGSGMGGGNSMGGGRTGASTPMGSGGSGAPGSNTMGNSAPVTSSANGYGNGALNSSSRGVIGMQGVALNTSAEGNTQTSVLSSASGTVKLDNGTQIILLSAAPAKAQ